MKRKWTKKVMVGDVPVGGGEPIAVQSMLNRPAHDLPGNVEQAVRLKEAGCRILRAAVPDQESVRLVEAVKDASGIPFVADIHFDYRLALESVAAGADAIRINPGNIGGEDRVREVVAACRAKNIPIRVGVNGGSLEKRLLEKYGGPTAQALAESALEQARLIEKFDYDNIVLSAKSSDVIKTVECYRILSEQSDYPLHLGVTEAGTLRMGLMKSCVGIGSLLCDGIGDTIRVSLTADPVEEIRAGIDLLRACGLHSSGINLITCPTCGRTQVSLISLAEELESALESVAERDKPLTVALMGCAVNGPGEAREADFGAACGDGCGLIFRKGEIVGKVPEDRIVPVLLEMVREY